MPFMKRVLAEGTALIGDCVVPSFTNPNNLSIVTGAPPSVHGICGNYLFDVATGAEVMMNDPKWLRAPSILAGTGGTRRERGRRHRQGQAAQAARPRHEGHLFFIGEGRPGQRRRRTASTTVLPLVGMAVPDVYSAELSEFVFAAGVRLLETRRPDVMYLSTTDYVQHKHAPGDPDANRFYAMLDRYLARLDALGAVVGVTADHGMNAKTRLDASPNVIFLQDSA